ncbi:preprotein translocase subunit SecE [Candidatus Collierbacteria bacterium]|nr:preprotein translocase subunit SecE [Candidatus Collierbacteria bacterium]
MINPFRFVGEVKEELRKVDWPTREKTIRLTVIVVAASAFVGIYIGALDWLFTLLLTFLVK